MICQNSKGNDNPASGLGIGQCERGTVGTVTLLIERRGQEEGQTVCVCLACCEAIERQADDDKGHNTFCKRLAVVPVVGMPATVGIGSDSYPYTVTAVSASGKSITLQRNRYKAAADSNYFGQQKYEYSDEYQGEAEVWTLRTDGKWRRKGTEKGSGYYLCLGFRRAHSDPHF